jgi:sulfane dehydrogenase subunit SoxC
MLAGLTSQSEWTGVRLATVLREVGVRPKASWFLAEGSDAAVMARSIPVEKAFDDALIAYAQNGEAVRPSQGYPARLLLPGWEGNTSVKWLRRLEFSDRPFQTREETSKNSDALKDGLVRQFSFVMDARSLITFPAYPVRLEPGWVEIRGLAWTGRGRVTQVDVSTDHAASWGTAELQAPVLPKAHTRFRYLWKWDGKPTTILSRARDETGYTQPTRAQLDAARGKPEGIFADHYNPVIGWTIQRDGMVLLSPEAG